MSFQSEHTGIPINILAASGVQVGQSYTQFNEIDTIPSNALSSIGSYIVGAGQQFNLERVEFGGTVAAKFGVYVTPNGGGEVLSGAKRTTPVSLSGVFEYDTSDQAKQTLQAGDEINIKVIHETALNGQFEIRLQGTIIS
jgi:hypothetical protein